MRKLLTALILFPMLTYSATPCTPRTGEPYLWEGSGMCTGNLKLEIPLPTLGMSLIYNSVRPNADFGFGNAGWKLSVDDRLVYSTDPAALNQVHQIEVGDGTIYPFIVNGSQWTSQHLGITRSVVKFDSSNPNGIWEKKSGIKARFGTVASPNNALNMSSPPSSALFLPLGSFLNSPSVGRLSNPPANVLTEVGSATISDRNGVVTQISRDSKNHITLLQDAYGQKITFTLNSGYTTQMKDFSGNTYLFRYDAQGRLSSVTYPDNSQWEIRYHEDKTSNEYLVFQITDPTDDATQLAYASNTALPISETAWGKPVSPLGTLGSCDNGGVTGVVCTIFGVKSQYIYKYSYSKNSVSVVSQITSHKEIFYDNGGLMQDIENGLQIDYIRNAYLLPTMISDHIGRNTLYTYDARLNILSHTDPSGAVTSYEYNANDDATKVTSPTEVLTVAYGSTNLPTSLSSSAGMAIVIQRDTAGNPLMITENGRKVFQGTYDANGKITSMSDDSGLTQSYAYSKGYLTSHTDGYGFQVTITPNALGLPLSVRMPGQMAKNSSYDSMGRVTSDSLSGPSGQSVTYSAEYSGGYLTASNKPKSKDKLREEAAMQFSRFLATLLEATPVHAETSGEPTTSYACNNGPSGEESKDSSKKNGKETTSGGCKVAPLPTPAPPEYECFPSCGSGIVICPGKPKPKCYCGPSLNGTSVCCEGTEIGTRCEKRDWDGKLLYECIWGTNCTKGIDF